MEPKLDLSGITIQGSDTITLSGLNYSDTMSASGTHAVPNVSLTAGTGATYTSPYTFSGGTGINTSPWANTTSSKIKLDGADADIEINGISLLKIMQEIQNRLNLLQPNTALEAEWEELYALGKKYRELEQQIKDKQATWDRLKAMPPPEID